MTYFLDFIKQSPSATYLVTTKAYTVKKYGSDELAKRAALTDYYDEMQKALKNTNINYANALVRDNKGGILVMDIEGEYVPEEEESTEQTDNLEA